MQHQNSQATYSSKRSIESDNFYKKLNNVKHYDEKKIIGIVEEWEQRTGFVIKKEHKYNLWQRDVNCYFCVDEKGVIEYKGDALKNYDIGKEKS